MSGGHLLRIFLIIVVFVVIVAVNNNIVLVDDCSVSFFPGKSLKAFKEHVISDAATVEKIADLRKRVSEFASAFPMPGFDGH